MLAGALVIACGDGSSSSDQGQALTQGESAAESACIDRDGDGFGEGCSEGADCDDNDDTVFEQCGACLDTAEGCLCEPGTAPVTCTLAAEPDSKLCKTGLRSCRDGVWTACEGIAQFN
jgi:hypothetical protein